MLCRNKGFLLVELNLALLLMMIVMLMFSGSLKQLLQGWQKMQADVLLHRAARYSFALPERELFLHAAKVSIGSGAKGNSKVLCRDVLGSRQITFYLSGGILYRETKSNSLKGVNPLSLPSIKVQEFTAKRHSEKELLVKLKLLEPRSGRSLTASKVMALSNGVVE